MEGVVHQHRGLLAALGRAEEVEEYLKKKRAALAARYPERADELGEEQAAETKNVDKRLLRQLPGLDGMGR